MINVIDSFNNFNFIKENNSFYIEINNNDFITLLEHESFRYIIKIGMCNYTNRISFFDENIIEDGCIMNGEIINNEGILNGTISNNQLTIIFENVNINIENNENFGV